jgi:hypothetical protein
MKCGQKDCPEEAVVSFSWPGESGLLYACASHGAQAANIGRAIGVTVRLTRVAADALESVYRLGGLDALIEAAVLSGLHVADARELAAKIDREDRERERRAIGAALGNSAKYQEVFTVPIEDIEIVPVGPKR